MTNAEIDVHQASEITLTVSFIYAEIIVTLQPSSITRSKLNTLNAVLEYIVLYIGTFIYDVYIQVYTFSHFISQTIFL